MEDVAGMKELLDKTWNALNGILQRLARLE